MRMGCVATTQLHRCFTAPTLTELHRSVGEWRITPTPKVAGNINGNLREYYLTHHLIIP